MGKFDLTDTPITEDGIAMREEALGLRDNVVTRSFRGGVYGAGSQLSSLGGLAADAMGMEEPAASLRNQSASLRAQAALPQNAPRVASHRDVGSLRDAGEYVGGLVGGSLPYMGVGLAGALATGGAGVIPGMLGAAAALTPFEAGDVVQKQEADPVAMQDGSGDRLRNAVVAGGASALAQGIVPGGLAGRIAGKAVGKPLGSITGNVLTEGAAEGAGETIKQLGANVNAPLDTTAILDNAIGGAVAGGAFGAAGAGVDAVRGVAPGVKSTINERAAAAKAKLMPPAAEPTAETETKVRTAMDDLNDLAARGKEKFDDSLDRVINGQPLGDLKEFATAQGDRLTEMANFSENETVRKATEWGKEMMGDAGLTPERRQAVADAMANITDRASQVTIATAKKAWDMGREAAGKIDALHKAFKKRDIEGEVRDVTNALPGPKKSEDYSGAVKTIVADIVPILQKSQPHLIADAKSINALADGLRMAIAEIQKGPLSSDRIAKLIDVLGPDTATVLAKMQERFVTENPAKTEAFFKQVNDIVEVQKRGNDLNELVGKALTPEMQESVPASEVPKIVQGLREFLQKDRGGDAQRSFFDGAFRREMERYFGPNADKVSKALEKDMLDNQREEDSAESNVDDEGNMIESDSGTPRGQGPLYDEQGTRIEAAEPDAKVFGLTAPDKKGNSKSRRNGRAMLAPDIAAARGEKSYAAQHLADLKRQFPQHKVYFRRLPGSEYGHVVVKAGDPLGRFNDTEVSEMKLDTGRFANSPNRLDVGGEILDSARIASATARNNPDKFEPEGKQSRAEWLADQFKQGIARLTEQYGTVIEVPDRAVIGYIGGDPLTWGEAKKLDPATADDKASDDAVQRLNDLRETYARATWDDRKLKAAALKRLVLSEKELDALRSEAKAIADSMERARVREMLTPDDKGSARDRQMGKVEKFNDALANKGLNAKQRGAVARRSDRGPRPFEQNDARFDDEGKLTAAGVQELLSGDADGGIDVAAPSKSLHELDRKGTDSGQGRKEVGKDENIHLASAALKDDELVNRSNMDGTPHDAPSTFTNKMLGEARNLLIAKAGEWARVPSEASRRIARRLQVLLKDIHSMAEADQLKLRALVVNKEAAENLTASQAADVVNALAKKYAGSVLAPGERATDLVPDKGPIQKNPIRFKGGKKDDAAMYDEQAREAMAEDAAAEGTPDPKSVAAKKAAFLAKAASGDKGLLGELKKSTDAKGLQRAAGLLASRIDDAVDRLSGREKFADGANEYNAAVGTLSALADNGVPMEQIQTHPMFTDAIQKLVAKILTGSQDARRFAEKLRNVEDQIGSLSKATKTEAKVQNDLVRGGATLGQLMRHISEADDVPAQFKVVAAAVNKVARTVPVRLVSGLEAMGTFNTTKGDIQIDNNGRTKTSTVLHEGVHAATVRAMATDPELHKAVYALMAHVRKQDPTLRDAYGMTTSLEFLAEAMSNEGFQARLKKIPASNSVAKWLGENVANAWDAFVGMVRKALQLGPDEHSALSQVMELTGYAMKAVGTDGLGVKSSPEALGGFMNTPVIPVPKAVKLIDAVQALMPGNELLAEYLGNVREYATNNDGITHADAVTLASIPEVYKEIVQDGEKPTAEWVIGIMESLGQQNDQTLVPSKLGGLNKTLDTVNARLRELVQDPDVAYGLQTKKYSLVGVGIHNDLNKPGFPATHDSPIRHEGKFDWRKHSGKGEGNASFGAGTYLSTADGVHKSYKGQFTAAVGGPQELTMEQTAYANKADVADTAKAHIAGLEKRIAAPSNARLVEDLQRELAHRRKVLAGLEQWLKDHSKDKPPSSVISPTYEVSVNIEPHQILDWDKPLSEQSEFVQKALSDKLEQMASRSPQRTGLQAKIAEGMRNATGQKAYWLFTQQLGSQEAASDYLQSLGILGHKYAAGGGKNDRHPNYVIYDDSKIETNYVHFSQQSTGATAHTQAQRDSVKAYLDRVLGTSVRRAWANLTHAGEFDSVANVIRISIHALNPLSVAHHEALHAFFKQLRDQGATDITEAVMKAANSPHVIAQLQAYFANEPGVLGQLSDPEERAAYMYQLWAAKVPGFTIGPQVKTRFQKIAKYIRELLGIWSNDERALHILEYFDRGDYAQAAGSPNAVYRALMAPGRNKAVDALESLSKPLLELAEALVATGSGRMRDTGIPALQELADIIKRDATEEGGDQGFIQAARVEASKRRTAMAKALADFTPEQLQEAQDALQRNVPATTPEARLAVRAIKGLLSDTRDYMVAGGVDVGNLGPDYYPRVWDIHYISKNLPAFRMMLDRYVRTGQMQGNPDDFIARLMSREGNEFGIETRKPGMQHTKVRLLDFITPADAAEFVTKDLFGTMNSYITQAARRTEWERRLGGNRLDALFIRAKVEGATDKQLEMADEYLRGVDGTLGDSLNPQARRIMGNMIVYQNIRLLPLAMFSSIVDPMGVIVRGGTMKDAWSTFARGIREIPRSYGKEATPDAMEQLAETLGVIDTAILNHTMGDLYTQGMVGGTAQKINNAFFRLNLMEGLNRSFRVGATEAALKFLQTHAGGNASTHSTRWLRELGLRQGDIITMPNGRIALSAADGLSPDQLVRVHAAINQWVDTAVLRPDAADKPIWMNDPHFALISHLKQFTYAFQKTIIGRVVHEFEQGNLKPAMALASYVPVMIGADFIKGLLQGGGDQPEWKQGWTAADYIGHGIQRAGLLGVGQFGWDAADDLQEGGIGAGALVGPTIEQFIDAVQVLGGSKEFAPVLMKALPANALYKDSVAEAGT